jgi:hypothetical protein
MRIAVIGAQVMGITSVHASKSHGVLVLRASSRTWSHAHPPRQRAALEVHGGGRDERQISSL